MNSLFIIRKGQVRVLQRDVLGKYQTVTLLEQGDFFGDIAPTTEGGRVSNFGILTTRVCEVLELSGRALDDIITRYPRIKGALRRHYMNRLSTENIGRNEPDAQVN